MTSSRPSEPEGNALLFESLVICDDIRSESNGKLILVGVYSDVIQVAKLPLQMRSLALGIKARAMAVGRMRFSVVVADPQGNTLLDAGGELDYQGEIGRVIWLPLVLGGALLPTEGPYSVRISLADGPTIHENFIVRKAVLPEVRVSETKAN